MLFYSGTASICSADQNLNLATSNIKRRSPDADDDTFSDDDVTRKHEADRGKPERKTKRARMSTNSELSVAICEASDGGRDGDDNQLTKNIRRLVDEAKREVDGMFRVTRKFRVEDIAYVEQVPKRWPIPTASTAFVVDFSKDSRAQQVTKGGRVKSLDAFLKAEVRVSSYANRHAIVH